MKLSLKTVVCVVFLVQGLIQEALSTESSERALSLIFDLYPKQELTQRQDIDGVKMQSTQVAGEMDCVSECIAVYWCRSVNFGTIPLSNGQYKCELLSTEQFNNGENMTENNDVNHYSVKNPCQEKPCQNGGECIFQDNRKDFRCKCKSGSTGEQCEKDINECSSGGHACNVNARCTNTAGSYTCQCKSGYQGDGRSCSCTPVPVGMETRTIPDSSLTASSEWDANRNPKNGRINSAFCWGARQARVGEWIQIDLGKTLRLTGIATQGEGGSQYTKSIKIQYSTSGITSSSPYVESGRIFDANTAGNGQIVKINFNAPFDARYVRVYPQTWQGFVVLRLELYHSC